MSQNRTRKWGIVIHRLCSANSPVMYSAFTPSFLRKRKISQKKTASLRMNQKPTSQKIRSMMKSMSPA
ncbi:MAG: hypothetical protein JRG94_22085 [Deltaproteobacteria bacterium]|nr:hypothetical protein [Deltaproteobacteria bacterium]